MTLRKAVEAAKQKGFTNFYFPGRRGKLNDLYEIPGLPKDGWEFNERKEYLMSAGTSGNLIDLMKEGS